MARKPIDNDAIDFESTPMIEAATVPKSEEIPLTILANVLMEIFKAYKIVSRQRNGEPRKVDQIVFKGCVEDELVVYLPGGNFAVRWTFTRLDGVETFNPSPIFINGVDVPRLVKFCLLRRRIDKMALTQGALSHAEGYLCEQFEAPEDPFNSKGVDDVMPKHELVERTSKGMYLSAHLLGDISEIFTLGFQTGKKRNNREPPAMCIQIPDDEYSPILITNKESARETIGMCEVVTMPLKAPTE